MLSVSALNQQEPTIKPLKDLKSTENDEFKWFLASKKVFFPGELGSCYGANDYDITPKTRGSREAGCMCWTGLGPLQPRSWGFAPGGLRMTAVKPARRNSCLGNREGSAELPPPSGTITLSPSSFSSLCLAPTSAVWHLRVAVFCKRSNNIFDRRK